MARRLAIVIALCLTGISCSNDHSMVTGTWDTGPVLHGWHLELISSQPLGRPLGTEARVSGTGVESCNYNAPPGCGGNVSISGQQSGSTVQLTITGVYGNRDAFSGNLDSKGNLTGTLRPASATPYSLTLYPQ